MPACPSVRITLQNHDIGNGIENWSLSSVFWPGRFQNELLGLCRQGPLSALQYYCYEMRYGTVVLVCIRNEKRSVMPTCYRNQIYPVSTLIKVPLTVKTYPWGSIKAPWWLFLSEMLLYPGHNRIFDAIFNPFLVPEGRTPWGPCQTIWVHIMQRPRVWKWERPRAGQNPWPG